jgi:hypothetical protein
MIRSKLWRAVAVAWVIINAGGAAYAVGMGERIHAGVHVALLAAGYLVWRATRRSRTQRELETPQLAGDLNEDLTHLQQSVDAVAIEVERIGEGQRFINRLFNDKGVPDSPDKNTGDRAR